VSFFVDGLSEFQQQGLMGMLNEWIMQKNKENPFPTLYEFMRIEK
jgi:hypothetical protein